MELFGVGLWYIYIVHLGVYLGLRSKKNVKQQRSRTVKKQSSKEAEKQRSREAGKGRKAEKQKSEKQNSGEAEKQGKEEQQKSKEAGKQKSLNKNKAEKNSTITKKIVPPWHIGITEISQGCFFCLQFFFSLGRVLLLLQVLAIVFFGVVLLMVSVSGMLV